MLVYQSPKNPNSHLTLKDRKWPSYPTKYLLSVGKIQGRTLDFGCGNGVDVAFLRNNGVEITGYDPYYAPQLPTGLFDTILCHYVLNVLLPEEQAHVLMAVSELLKPSGKAYFTVRRDIKNGGFRIHQIHGVKVYQCNVVLPYKSVLKTDHCEIYEYKKYNQISRVNSNNCPFCIIDTDCEIITESASVYAILNKYPDSPGHALIIPKQHEPDFFALSERSQTACLIVVARVKMLLSQRFKPRGFYMMIDIGETASQSIPHAHIHLIPRYANDVANSTGGKRNVI